MKAIQIAREVLSDLERSFDEKTRDEVAKSFLKTVADKFGTEFISECITQHPNKGYSVRYLDDFTPNLITKQHSENLKKNNDLIKSILLES